MSQPRVAIVDYGLGNLYSVKHACGHVGLDAAITSSKQDLLASSAVILPGVGAFGDAMDSLRRLDLVNVLRDIASSSTPLVGICLGQQLLMTESYEFGRHRGLDVIPGVVVPIADRPNGGRRLKVPHIGWNRIYRMPSSTRGLDPWARTPLAELDDGEWMYFVHSYVVQPEEKSHVVSCTRYGSTEFCAALHRKNIFACQFHPERSGPQGIQVYRGLSNWLYRDVTWRGVKG